MTGFDDWQARHNMSGFYRGRDYLSRHAEIRVFFVFNLIQRDALMPTPNSISKSQLYRLIGTSECPVILDVRVPEDYDDDPRLLPSALKR